MSTLELNADFRDILIALADAGAEFVLIGGWAVAAHGHVRGTDDLDILVRSTPANAGRVFEALALFGAPVQAHSVTAGLFAEAGYGYRMGVKPHLIELLTVVDGISFDDAMVDHIVIEIEGRSVPVIGRDALLRNKRAAGRAKDLADVEALGTLPPSDSGLSG